MKFGCWMRSPCPPKLNGNVDIQGNLDVCGYPLDIQISNGSPEIQSHIVHNLHTVGFLYINDYS